MDKRILGALLVVGGAILALLSALADPLGIGSGGFGTRQVVGVVIGMLAIFAGAALGAAARRPPRPGPPREPGPPPTA